MNQENVKALASLLAKSPWEIELRDLDRRLVDEDSVSTTLAEWLASRGVLVPSALTEDEARQIPEYEGAWSRDEYLPAVREALERIAKGEA